MNINANNSAKLQSALDLTNGKADSHTFTSGAILRLQDDIQKHLSEWFTKKELSGIKGFAISSSPVSRSYKYPRTGNRISFVLGSKGVLFITSIEKITLFPNMGGALKFKFSDAQKETISRKAIDSASSV